MRDSAYLRRNAERRDRIYAEWRAERSTFWRVKADNKRTKTMDTESRPGTPVTAEQIRQAQDPRGRAPVPYQQDEQVLTAEEIAFRDAHRQLPRYQVLMSASHPTGWKLELLLKQLRDELEVKNARLYVDDSALAQAVVKGNQMIMGCLFEAEGYQRRLQAVLNAIAPDQGPLGRPRVGLGSKV